MARFPIAPLTKGLNTLLDAAAGDPQASPDLKDVRGHTGILTLRKGYRVLDIEPSHVAGVTTKDKCYLTLDGVNDYLYNNAWAPVLGQNWTVRMAVAFAIGSINNTNGSRTILHNTIATDTSSVGDPIKIYMTGSTPTGKITLSATVSVADTTGIGISSTPRTIAEWTTLCPSGADQYLRLTRNGDALALYVGETLVASGTGLGTASHAAATFLKVGRAASAATPEYANINITGSLVITNRVLTEAEAYWGIHYPTDVNMPLDTLGCWHFMETAGNTITDYSSYKEDLTNSGGTWTGESHAAARGLGITSWRRSNGDLYHTLACSRRGTDSANNKASGALYTWKAAKAFTPFYFGGVVAADETTAGLDELDLLARWSFVQGRDMLLGANGVDFCRKYRTSYQYLGGTAPPTAPLLDTPTALGGTGITATWLYAYSYYNSATGTETGLSPTASISIANKSGVNVIWFPSSDSQFDYVRIYRSKTSEPTLYLLTEQAMGTGGPYADTKTDTNLGQGVLCPGSDIPGNRNRKRAYLGFPDYPNTPVQYQTPAANRTRTFPPGASKGPGSAPALAQSGSSSVNNGVHYIAYSYYNSTDLIETGMSPATAITVTGTQQIDITGLVLPPEGSKYNQMRIYRTKAGAYTWYLAQTLNVATTATETQADSALTATIETNALPPRFEGMTAFANRLWGFVGPTLYWSTHGFFEDFPESNGFAPKSGVDITAICATDGALFVHFKDETIHLLPHPGDEPDLAYFVPVNLRQWSPIGAAIGHFTAQAVPGGVIWLAKDGFYKASPTTLEKISGGIDPTLATLNVGRGAVACSLYDVHRRIYRCWLSRSASRLNDECFVYYLDDGTWWLDSIHADAAGVLYDAQETPHYCFLVENGILCELSESLDYDGDGTGTLTGAVASPSATHFSEIGSYTAPVGGDGGYPVWFVKSDGTTIQRYRVDNAVAVSPATFYPSYVGLTSGTWTAYYHGIRGYIKTMLLHLGDLRHPKNIISCFFFNRVQSAGGLQVNLARDEGTLTAVNQDVDLTLPVSQVTPAHGSGRVFQFEIYSDPPAASRPWGLKGLEIEAEMDMTDAGS